MKSLYSSLAACFLAVTFLVPSAFAQLPATEDFTSTSAKAAIKKFEANQNKLKGFYSRAKADMTKKYREEMQSYKTTLLRELEEARKTATLADELDEALKIRDAIAKLEALDISPSDHVAEPLTAPSKKIRELQQQIASLQKELAKSKGDLAKAANTPTLPALHAAVTGTWVADNGSVWIIGADSKVTITQRGRLDAFWAAGGTIYFAGSPSDGTITILLLSNGPGYRGLVFRDATTIVRDSPKEKFVLKKKVTR